MLSPQVRSYHTIMQHFQINLGVIKSWLNYVDQTDHTQCQSQLVGSWVIKIFTIIYTYSIQQQNILHKCRSAPEEGDDHDAKRRYQDDVDSYKVLLKLQYSHPFVESGLEAYPQAKREYRHAEQLKVKRYYLKYLLVIPLSSHIW